MDGFSLLRMYAIGERARTGQPVFGPYGTTRQFLGFDELVLLPAQLARFPLEDYQTVSTRTTIGKNARKPLELATPIMIAGMAYGAALSKRAKVCLAQASSLIDIATNSGESGFLPEERQAARKYIVQWNGGRWGNDLADMTKADAIEIQVGQGAEGSLGARVKASDIRPDLRAHLGLESGDDAVRPAWDITHPVQFKDLVDTLREASGGVSIGLKLAAGRIEEDLAVAIHAGVDFVTVDGAQGGTGGGREITINNTAIPLVYAIPRAR
ncbi:MAG: hypothetical protein GX162_09885 [Firmicutes bacterium]|nr:hypothetical protein [Bacillota bacterium]